MPRFSSNISMMFLEYDLLDRFQAAQNAGFGAIEIQFPYDTSVADLLIAKEDAGVDITVLNIGVGDLISGGPGIAAVPGREDHFKAAVEAAYDYAATLKPITMNVLSGWPSMEDFTREQCLDVLASNLNYAAAAFDDTGATVLTEAVNNKDRPGYLINHTAEALDVIDRAGHANLKIEYDLYHMQIMEGDLVNTLRETLDRIGNIQFADTPGRHEPGTGEINYRNVFKYIHSRGFDGVIGMEHGNSVKGPDGENKVIAAYVDADSF